MLEIRNVTKVYRSKTGESVKALDSISISFPRSGMVFLLGRSGSGKSTLLNVIGGLDSCDDGEFIIKGKSSKNFRGSDFDAYRNTFIGFIFQEYNVLDDFSVGANIGLALELQGKKATSERINAILDEVDLANYARRKPNELSGGQKQRVAIARALVKEPEIIMADEPTGALDSNTGKQIFDTLKKLSKKKLVIVVSHDRDFAEKYADRIIELADGSVISDVTKHEQPGERISEGIDRISHNLFKINRGYRLTQRDIAIINQYIEENDCDVIISGDGRVNQELRSAAGITESGGTTVFERTDADKDVELLQYDGKKTSFIHSRLPLKNALRIGSSGLRHKKFRLAMTIILSTIAFTLFGLSDTMAAYNKIQAATDSLIDSNVKYTSFSLGVANYYMYDGKIDNKYFVTEPMNGDDIKKLSELTGLDFIPVFTGGADEWSGGFSIAGNYLAFSSNQVFNGKLAGVISADSSTLDSAGLTLAAGRLPTRSGEIVISELTYRSFKEYGFKNEKYNEEVKADSILSFGDILGKHITMSSSMTGESMSYEIVGILDTAFDYERFESFLPSDIPQGGGISDMVLSSELETELKYGFHSLVLLSPADIEILTEKIPVRYEDYGEYLQGWNNETYLSFSQNTSDGGEMIFNFHKIGTDELIEKLDIFWVGDAKTSLAENEVIMPYSMMGNLLPYEFEIQVSTAEFEKYIDALYGEGAYNAAVSEWNGDLSFMSAAESAAFNYYSSMNIQDYNVSLDLLDFALENIWGVSDMLSSSIQDKQALLRYSDIFYSIQINSPVAYISLYDATEAVCNAYDISGLSYDREAIAFDLQCTLLSASGKDISSLLSNIKIDRVIRSYELNTESVEQSYSVKIVGFAEENAMSSVGDLVICNNICKDYKDWYQKELEADEFYNMSQWIAAEHDAGIWSFAISPITEDPALVEKLVRISYDDSGEFRFDIRNSIMSTLNSFNDFIEIGAKIFLYIGIGFAVFSAFLLMNFIATSISYKKREIGILRAVGARSSDVFKIFFSEALLIALINFLLSTLSVIFATLAINNLMRDEGIRITLLNFGIRQLALMLLISVAVALLASFLPVNRIARRKPVDAIKDR